MFLISLTRTRKVSCLDLSFVTRFRNYGKQMTFGVSRCKKTKKTKRNWIKIKEKNSKRKPAMRYTLQKCMKK